MRLFLLRSAAAAISLLPLALAPAALVAPPPAAAVDLQGQTWFRTPPWQVIFTSYYSDVNQVGEYYFTVTLPETACVGLGGLTITQTRGTDRSFNFDLGHAAPSLVGPAMKVPLCRFRSASMLISGASTFNSLSRPSRVPR
jgi:hypothetical protein